VRNHHAPQSAGIRLVTARPEPTRLSRCPGRAGVFVACRPGGPALLPLSWLWAGRASLRVRPARPRAAPIAWHRGRRAGGGPLPQGRELRAARPAGRAGEGRYGPRGAARRDGRYRAEL